MAIIYNPYLSFSLLKLILILLKVIEDILKIIFILILTNKKVFSKN